MYPQVKCVTESVDPAYAIIVVFLILAWRSAGYLGLDRFVLPRAHDLFRIGAAAAEPAVPGERPRYRSTARSAGHVWPCCSRLARALAGSVTEQVGAECRGARRAGGGPGRRP